MLDGEGLDERVDSDQEMEDSGFGGFMKVWYPAFLWMIGILMVLVLGSGMNGLNEKRVAEAAVRNAVPDKVTSHSDCKVLDKQVIAFRMISHYVDSSCGFFNVTSERYKEVSVGGVYDLVSTEFHGTGEPWITEVKALP